MGIMQTRLVEATLAQCTLKQGKEIL